MARSTTVEFAGEHRGWKIYRVVLRSRETGRYRRTARPEIYFEVRTPSGHIVPGGPKTMDEARALVDEKLNAR